MLHAAHPTPVPSFPLFFLFGLKTLGEREQSSLGGKAPFAFRLKAPARD